MQEERPALTSALTGADILRWYWFRLKLTAFARQLGVSAAGSKADLTDRISAALDGRDAPHDSEPAGRQFW